MGQSDHIVSSHSAPTLKRALGPMMATAIIVGTVIGSGVFKKPQAVAESVPNFTFVMLVWILGGVLALLGSLALSEVAVLYPRAGGNYVFLREAFGRLWGFLWGWVEFWIIRTASIAALATIVMESMHDIARTVQGLPSSTMLIGYWSERFLTVVLILGLGAVNIRGVSWGGWLQLIVTVIKVGALLAIVSLPLFIREPLGDLEVMPPTRSVPAFSWALLGTAMLGVQWAYHGWMNLGPVAEEIRSPQRNIPLAMIGGVGLVIALYLAANVAYHSVIPQDEMMDMKTTTVATAFCLRLIGPVGATLAAAAVMCSAFGSLNGNILVGPRLLFAMGRDRLVPPMLSEVHATFRTPVPAIIVQTGWACVLVLGVAALTQFQLPILSLSPDLQVDLNLPTGKALFDVLTDFAMFAAVIFETLAVATIFVFRWRMPNAERPYRCWGYPVVPIVYVVCLGAVAAATFFTTNQDGALSVRTEAVAVMGFVAVGAAFYGLVLRKSSI